MNVLIIDDDAEDTSLFCEALNELFPEANYTTVNTCAKVKDILHDISPDIIFMDGHMYPIGGKECLQLLNNMVDRDKVKIIVHTGSLSPVELIEFQHLGVDDILTKANSYQQLKSNIISIIVDKYSLAALPEL